MTYPPGIPVTLAQMAAMTPQLIFSTTLTAVTPTIPVTIPSGFNHVDFVWSGRSTTAATATNLVIQFNNDGTASYLWEQQEENNTTSTSATSGGVVTSMHMGTMPAASALASYVASGNFTVAAIQGGLYKTAQGNAASHANLTQVYLGKYGGQWNNTAQVTTVTLLPLAGSWAAGSTVSAYGRQ